MSYDLSSIDYTETFSFLFSLKFIPFIGFKIAVGNHLPPTALTTIFTLHSELSRISCINTNNHLAKSLVLLHTSRERFSKMRRVRKFGASDNLVKQNSKNVRSIVGFNSFLCKSFCANVAELARLRLRGPI